MDADSKRLTRSRLFTCWLRVPKRNASSSIVVHLRFSFSSFSLNCRIQDESARLLPQENQNQDAHGNPIPAEAFEGVGLNEAEEPFHCREGNHRRRDGSQNHHAPMFARGSQSVMQ